MRRSAWSTGRVNIGAPVQRGDGEEKCFEEESANSFTTLKSWNDFHQMNFYGLAADRQEYCFTKDI